MLLEWPYGSLYDVLPGSAAPLFVPGLGVIFLSFLLAASHFFQPLIHEPFPDSTLWFCGTLLLLSFHFFSSVLSSTCRVPAGSMRRISCCVQLPHWRVSPTRAGTLSVWFTSALLMPDTGTVVSKNVPKEISICVFSLAWNRREAAGYE